MNKLTLDKPIRQVMQGSRKDYIIFGIDASSRSTGTAWMDLTGKLLGYDAIILPKKWAFGKKLSQYRFSLLRRLQAVQPMFVGMEELNYFRNAQTARVLGSMRGVTMEIVYRYNQCDVWTYCQPTLKKNLGVRHIGTQKSEVAKAVEQRFGIQVPRDKDLVWQDICDSIAVAWTLFIEMNAMLVFQDEIHVVSGPTGVPR